MTERTEPLVTLSGSPQGFEPVTETPPTSAVLPAPSTGGISEEEAKFAFPAAEPAPAPTKPKRIVRFVDSDSRHEVVLTNPVATDEKTYAKIIARRMTIAQIQDHFSNPDPDKVLPVFIDEDGAVVPSEVIKALSFEDYGRVTTAAESFLRFASPDEETPLSTSTNGEASPPS